MTSRVAIVIPVFNGMPHLAKCLASLAWVSGTTGVYVVVADSGSTDGSHEFLAAEHPWVHVVRGNATMWWAAATNLGCRFAVEELRVGELCLLNHDCTWSVDSFQALLRCHAQEPSAIHCSRVLLPDGKILFAGGVVAASGMLVMRGWGLDEDPGFPPGRVAWCGGMGVVLPAALWRRLGGFDQYAFPHYHADADFCLRAARLGVPTWYCPSSTVVNDKSSSGLKVRREGATVPEVWATLWSRKSSTNVKDCARFYARHRGLRALPALAHLYYIHLGSSAMRLTRHWSSLARWKASPTSACGEDRRAVADVTERDGERPLRVLMVSDLWPLRGTPGHAAFVRQASLALAEAGHEVSVLLLCRVFPPQRLLRALLSPRTVPRVATAWVREARARFPLMPPAVTTVHFTAPPRRTSQHAWGRWATWLSGPCLLRVARGFDPDVIHGHWATPGGHTAVWLAGRLDVPAVVSVHGYDIDFTPTLSGGKRAVASVLARADVVVANSGQMAQAAARLRGTAQGVSVVWQGGDLLGSCRRVDGPVRVISVGHIVPHKGYFRAARALASCREGGAEFMWTIIGEGPANHERALRHLVRMLGLDDCVNMVHGLTNAAVLQKMSESDIFLLLSTREPYGVVYAEAMGAGLAVVGSTAAGAVADFEAAGAPIVAVPPTDERAAADALHDLMTSPDRRREMRARSQEWARQNLGWARHAEHLEVIYRGLVCAKDESGAECGRDGAEPSGGRPRHSQKTRSRLL